MDGFAGRWSGGSHLWWKPSKTDAELTIPLPAPTDGDYELIGYFTRAKDYAKIQVRMGDQNVGSEQNLYDTEVVPTGPISLGTVTLKKGANPLVIRVTGKDDKSTGYLVGIDAFVLKAK